MIYKVKDNINLEELIKYGYEYGKTDIMQPAYIKELEYGDYIAIYPDNRKICVYVEDFCGNSWSKFVDNLLQDLKEANLIEKLENKNE